ncbi:DUF3019 domain-containing protein [Shewanella litorisediminis]|uniref:DUF3019 domain-containing protein n=1 Tax=Shewanella litorisediminis TaxID=1173586 RepID=UPI002014E6DD|nr:DUF3019 domain-containing protein [Shewanella litorisediminis]MCL2918989.1 DUF3019 domain-containing protein [Shewanella litorisediminis]
MPLISLLGLSASQANESSKPFEVTPSLCLTDKASGRCDIRVTLTWYTDDPVCIEVNLPDLPRWCISDDSQDSLTLDISTDKDLHFVMRDEKSNQPLADAVLEVKPLSEPQTRRRFRNPWSIF